MENDKSINWIKLLRYYESNGFISNGLTIPFLVGIYQENYKGNKDHLLDSFLSELNAQVISGKVKISYCSYLEEDVVSTLKTRDRIVPRPISGIKTAQYLEKYNSIIQEGLFSKIDDEWSPYSFDDIERIKAARESMSDNY